MRGNPARCPASGPSFKERSMAGLTIAPIGYLARQGTKREFMLIRSYLVFHRGCASALMSRQTVL